MSASARKRTQQKAYINVTNTSATPTLAFMGDGFSALDEKPNAQTKSKQYISNDSATSSVNRFEPSWDYNIDQIRSEAAVRFLTDCGELRKTGDEAITQLYIVDADRPAEANSTTKFHCRMNEVAVSPSNFGNDDNEMTGEGSLLGRGDPVEGVFDLEKLQSNEYPFTKGWTEPVVETPPSTSSETPPSTESGS